MALWGLEEVKGNSTQEKGGEIYASEKQEDFD